MPLPRNDGGWIGCVLIWIGAVAFVGGWLWLLGW